MIKRGMELVEKIAEEDPGVYSEGGKKPQFVLRNIREYDALIELRFYVDTPKKMRITKSKIIAQIIKEFEKEKIEFSTPKVIYRQE
ncbi:hypothetical protein BMS3Bbin15_00886 [archaeon BMS3Bbin15]|nr:hypothetical protein BMS3Bbin15_00886 [archaeon BMS3Bbin15]